MYKVPAPMSVPVRSLPRPPPASGTGGSGPRFAWPRPLPSPTRGGHDRQKSKTRGGPGPYRQPDARIGGRVRAGSGAVDPPRRGGPRSGGAHRRPAGGICPGLARPGLQCRGLCPAQQPGLRRQGPGLRPAHRVFRPQHLRHPVGGTGCGHPVSAAGHARGCRSAGDQPLCRLPGGHRKRQDADRGRQFPGHAAADLNRRPVHP